MRLGRQKRIQQIKMPLFRRAMPLSEVSNGGVFAEGKDATIDNDRAGLPGMVRP